MLNEFLLTFDVDWAPDFVIDEVVDFLLEKKLKATWFITHDSPSIRKILEHKEIFEFGLHPNFLSNSSQGTNEKEVMNNLRKIIPDSKIIRTHALFQSTYLFRNLVKNFDLKIDVSLLLPDTPNLQPHKIYFDEQNNELIRVPFFWEDDIEMYNPKKSLSMKSERYHVEGLKIFDFHPIHIFLNSNNMENYESLKKSKPLLSLKPNEVKPFVNEKSTGINNFFKEFCDYILNKQKQSFTISEIIRKWNNSN